MKLKHYLTYLILVIALTGLSAQSNNQMAKSEFIAAEDAYNQGNYSKCLQHLDKAEELVGNNRLFQYLRVKAYYSKEDYQEAQEQLSIFFNITPEKYSDEPKYQEMVAMISPLKTHVNNILDEEKRNTEKLKRQNDEL